MLVAEVGRKLFHGLCSCRVCQIKIDQVTNKFSSFLLILGCVSTPQRQEWTERFPQATKRTLQALGIEKVPRTSTDDSTRAEASTEDDLRLLSRRREG